MKKRNKCIPCHLHPDSEHWFRKGQSWKAKVAYESEDDAWEFLNQNPKLRAQGMAVYRCRICNKYHIGHKNNKIKNINSNDSNKNQNMERLEWKKDFLDWVQEPRRKTCKDFVDYMEALQNRVLYKIIADTCDKYGNMREGQIQDITEAVEKCVAECAKEARKLIDECQPVKFF